MSYTNSWQPIGPAPQISRNTGTVSGRIRCLTVSSDFDGNQTPAMYIGSDGGGLWRSVDFQSKTPSWINLTDPISESLGAGASVVTALAVDPIRPQTLYVAVGDI